MDVRTLFLALLGLLSSSFVAADAFVGRSFTLQSDGREVAIQDGSGKTVVCKLGFKADSAEPSSDGAALIVSDTEYVLMDDLSRCGASDLPKKSIPAETGSLIDVNIEQGLYLSIDVISTPPLRFLATVARIGTSRNLVDLPGSYVGSMPLEQLQRYGFAYEASFTKGRISADGRFVSPSGVMDCGLHGYPGVWDISANRRVVAPADVQEHGIEAISSWCRSLFSRTPSYASVEGASQPELPTVRIRKGKKADRVPSDMPPGSSVAYVVDWAFHGNEGRIFAVHRSPRTTTDGARCGLFQMEQGLPGWIQVEPFCSWTGRPRLVAENGRSRLEFPMKIRMVPDSPLHHMRTDIPFAVEAKGICREDVIYSTNDASIPLCPWRDRR